MYFRINHCLKCLQLQKFSNFVYFTTNKIRVTATYQRSLWLAQIEEILWSYWGDKPDHLEISHLSDLMSTYLRCKHTESNLGCSGFITASVPKPKWKELRKENSTSWLNWSPKDLIFLFTVPQVKEGAGRDVSRPVSHCKWLQLS